MDSKNLSLNSTGRRGILSWLKNNLLLLLTILSVFAGIALGCILRLVDYDDDFVMLIGFPGDLFMRMLRVLIVPLIVSSLISGLAQMDIKCTGRIGSRVIAYIFGTTLLATVLGIFLALVIHPGNSNILDLSRPNQAFKPVSALDSIMDSLRNIFPENLVQATFQKVRTEYVKGPRIQFTGKELSIDWSKIKNETVEIKGANGIVVSTELHHYKLVRSYPFKPGTNALGLIVFSIGFGIICGQLGKEAETLVKFFAILNKIIMRLVVACMYCSPVGIVSIITAKILLVNNFYASAHHLGLFIFTVILGLSIHAFITLPAIYYIVTRKNPIVYMGGMLQALFTALGTASSAATLPVTIKCAEENNHVHKVVAKFMLTLGASINMDGTAIYQAIAGIFFAQLYAVQFNFGQIIIVFITASAASIVGAAVPSAGLSTMMLMLGSLGVPTQDVSVIFSIDWFFDRLRTSVNVLSDSIGAGVVYYLSKSELENLDAKQEIEFLEDRQSIPLKVQM